MILLGCTIEYKLAIFLIVYHYTLNLKNTPQFPSVEGSMPQNKI